MADGEEYPALFQLFAGFFNQDWKPLFGSMQGAVDEFLGETTKEYRQCVVSELDRLIASGLKDRELNSLVYHRLSLGLDPSGFGFTLPEWLSWLRGQINR